MDQGNDNTIPPITDTWVEGTDNEGRPYRYMDTIKSRHKICPDNEHFFVAGNHSPNGREAKCAKCDYGKYIIAGVHDIVDGKIVPSNQIYRDNNDGNI